MDGGTTCHDASGLSGNDLPTLALPKSGPLRAAIADEDNPQLSRGYDLLRTRLLGAVAERGLTRIGVAQAADRNASALTALNLALSEARRLGRRVTLVDMDIAEQPVLRALGETPPIVLPSNDDPRAVNIAAINSGLTFVNIPAPATVAATRLMDPTFLTAAKASLAPLRADITIVHLPPLLKGDAGIAAIRLVEGVLLVVDGMQDTSSSLLRCQTLIGEACPVLGVFLFNAEV